MQNGKVLVAVGCCFLPPFPALLGFASTELYDPTINSFAPPALTATMQQGRAYGAVAVLLLDGRVLIAGGVGDQANASLTVLDSTELYDPVPNSFAPPVSMNFVRVYPTATLIHAGRNAGRVLIAGGLGPNEGDERNALLASTDLYDPATNSFAPPAATATMNTARMNAVAVELSNGKILIAGGGPQSGSPVASTELYDEPTNSFEPASTTPNMNTARAGASASAIVLNTGPNAGKVLIVGGDGAQPPALASTELYDPVTNTFAPPDSTPTHDARAGAILIELDDGKILVAGSALIELYDPVANTFTLGPSLPVSGAPATATLLK